ncbi:MAG: YdcF family protein [Flavobacteriales bacterium]
MFFIISKILGFLTSPFTWIAIGIVFALFTKVPERKKKALIISCVIFLIFSNEFLAEEVIRTLEVENVKIAEDEQYEVGIILGGMIRYDARNDRIIFNNNIDRLLQPLVLQKKGKIKKLLISGGSGDINFPEIKEAALLQKFVCELGFDSNDVWIETKSRNTHENALFCKEVLRNNLKDYNSKKILLITSATHMKRSIGCFEKEGVKVAPYGTSKLSGPRHITYQKILIPNVYAVHAWEVFFHETIGLWTYKLAGYID